MYSRTLAGFLVSLTLFASFSRAGDLNPPPGPVTPTQRTPINASTTPGDANSLFKITQPGSYYLTSNVTGVTGRSGIEIASANVTIDLNGFAVIGVPGALNGILADSTLNLSSIVVRNGSVSNWPGVGIDLFNAGSGSLIEGINAHNNVSWGIRCANAGVIRWCTASDNGNIGIIGVNSSIVESCNALSNGSTGILSGPGSQIRGCVARDNSVGINAGFGASIIDCGAYTNTSNGIVASDGCNIERCNASNNTGDGIQVQSHTRVSRCEVFDNGADGIQSGGLSCQITENNIGLHNATGAAGIRLGNGDTLVSGNNITRNTNGIVASIVNAGNIIIRNTFAGNTITATIDSTNRAAQFITPGANNFVSTDPNANLIY